MNYYDSAGQPFRLGARLGAGAEGAVFDIVGSPARVAKVYHQPPAAAKVDKLRAMISAADADMLRVAAWPVGTVHTAPNGPVAGIVLPKVTNFEEIHLLYSPAHRRAEFPRADWGHLIQTARNVAAAVETVHARGHVIGDVNQKNFTVAANATVMLVDCDSFQITYGGTLHRCEVGVAHFTPPELQGRPFVGVTRTPNHDAFGLAVLCFHLLFMGRHPFAGRYLGPGDMPLEQAIQELRFPFGANARQRLMEPPPNAMSLATVPANVATMFEQAFGGTGTRPTAQQWRVALDAMRQQLKTCARVAVHKFLEASCTWCDLEARAGVIFFLGPATARASFDLAAAWSAIEKIAPPRPLATLPQPTIHGVVPRPPDPALLFRRRFARIARFVVPLVCAPFLPWWTTAAVIVVVFFLPLPGREEKLRRKGAFDSANGAWNDIQQRWASERKTDAFSRELAHLREKRDAYRRLDQEHARARLALESAKREQQLQQFLERFFLDHAKIEKIGSGRKATLASWGIETAADITWPRLSGVPGFGPALTGALLAWRAELERGFTFDASKGVDPREVARVDQKFAPQRRELELTLQAGPARLNALRAHVEAQRAQLTRDLETRATEWAQARADLDALH